MPRQLRVRVAERVTRGAVYFVARRAHGDSPHGLKIEMTVIASSTINPPASVLCWSLEQNPVPPAQTVDAIFRQLTLGALTGAGQA